MATSASAWFVGEGSLLVQCAEAFLRAGHQIAGVATSETTVRRWAANSGVNVVPIDDRLEAALAANPFDYLFSIVNLKLLSDAVIRRPRILAVNFHDGPLPRYAGLNAPAWALLAGETSYGVTWHEMTSTADAGRIAKQRVFDIGSDETSFSLNARCYEAGLESFVALVDDVTNDRVELLEQDFSRRTEFKRHDRPELNAMVTWHTSAEDIGRFVRACDFGPYPNPFGLPRVLSRAGIALMIDGRVSTTTLDGAEPGTVLAIESDAVTVATGTTPFDIRGLRRVSGEPLPLATWVRENGLEVGRPLALEPAAWLTHAVAWERAAVENERYWLRQLGSVERSPLPYLNEVVAPGQKSRKERRDMTVPDDAFAALRPLAKDWTSVVVALVGIYLARLNGSKRSTVAVVEPRLQPPAAAATPLVAGSVPIVVSLDGTVADVVNRVVADRQLANDRGTFFLDVAARYPALATPTSATGHPWPTPVMVGTDSDGANESPLSICCGADLSTLAWDFDAERLSDEAVRRMQHQLGYIAEALAADPSRPLDALPLMDGDERARMLVEWNATARPYELRTVHELIEAQAARTPDAPAIACRGDVLSYRELNERANRLAWHLKARGVGPDVTVGVCLDRSIGLIVSLLAVLKAGGAYVPLDPTYPADRRRFVAEDAKIAAVITEDRFAASFGSVAHVIRPAAHATAILGERANNPPPAAKPSNLAYVIYTSGSTGTPKGVMVEHRNVANFFAGMDECVPAPKPGVWLAVTSISFDISVLELFWTLARGFKVVVHVDDTAVAKRRLSAGGDRPLDFSLFYFSADEGADASRKYRLLLDGARFADAHGFSAVWTPERHFHAFGGLYPNPSVTSAAVAAVTERVAIRAGSNVLPLHHPVRVVEEWSVVDNISNGRVGISFAAGWQPNDFLLRPETFADRKGVMLREIETVRKLWRGETVDYDSPTGKTHAVKTHPRPVQPELPIWLTAAGNPETFQAAAKIGAGVLTHLLGQSVEELATKIAAYREAWTAAGHPGQGQIVLMLHTLVSDSDAFVRQVVRKPFMDYLRTSIELIKPFAGSFPTFAARGGQDLNATFASLSPEDYEALVEYSFERYFETSGLFGTPETCLAMTDRLRAIGVDEIACLIDFGVATDTVLANLPHLDRLRTMANEAVDTGDYSIAALAGNHGVTHLQCTPSMARMLMLDGESRRSLSGLKALLVGGEALSPGLAADLASTVAGEVWNMYGPTETTVWSTASRVDPERGVSIGRPLANQQIYILDKTLQPVPVGLTGDLYIGGDGVTRGYWQRPDLSAERFRWNPFQPGAHERIYFTGDVARYRADGSIEFLGRSDDQVKIRGHRIELGEVEAALAKQPHVQHVVVVVREDTPDDKRLVAYVVPNAGHTVSPLDLRAALAEVLPDYLVPSHIVELDAFPLTPNNKIDRRALPAPGRPASRADRPAAPATELEQTIAAVWQEVLRLPDVGPADNFFDLGGDSLLAAQVLSVLRARVREDIALTDLFRFPTVSALASQLGGRADTSTLSQSADRGRARQDALKQRRAARANLVRP